MENYFNDPQLQQAQAASQQAAGTANASAQTDVSLPQMLRDTLNAKFNDNNPMVQDRNNAATAYLSSIPSSQNDVLPQNNNGIVLSPTQQAMMMQAKQNAYLSPLLQKNSMLASQRGSLADVIANVTQAHKANTDALTQKAQLAHQSYQDILGVLSAKADQAYKQQELALRNKELGMQYGQIDLSGLLGGGQGGQGGQGGKMDRKSLQTLYAQQRNPAMQKAIENAWNIQNPGVSLFPKTIAGGDLNKASETRNTIDMINEALGIMNKGNVPVGGLFGLSGRTQAGLIKAGGYGANSDTKRLNELFTILSKVGEKNLIGGRLTGYLAKATNPAFPDIIKQPQDIIAELERMQHAGYSDLGDIAKSHSYDSVGQAKEMGVQPLIMLNPKGQKVRVQPDNILPMLGKGFKVVQ